MEHHSNPNPRVTMLVRSTLPEGHRALKAAAALFEAGYEVTLVGFQGGGLPQEGVFQGAKIVRVPSAGATLLRLQEQKKFLASMLEALRKVATLHSLATVANQNVFEILSHLAGWAEPLTSMFDFDRGVALKEHSFKANVWYAHNLDSLPTALRLRALYGGKVVYDSHKYMLDSNDAETPFARLAWNILEKVLIQEADQIVTVSESIARQLSEDYGIPKPAVVLNTPLFQAGAASVKPLRERYNVSQTFILVYAGSVVPQRGFEQLISVLPQMPDVAWVCFGQGETNYLAALNKLAQKHSVSAQVYFVGRVPPHEVQAAMGGANAGFVAEPRGALSHEYALPGKLFEYIFAGLPVVACDRVEIRNLVEEYGIGTLVDERDPQSIAGGIRRVQQEQHKYCGPAWEKQRTEMIDKYAWKNHQRVLVELIHDLAGRPVEGLKPRL